MDIVKRVLFFYSLFSHIVMSHFQHLLPYFAIEECELFISKWVQLDIFLLCLCKLTENAFFIVGLHIFPFKDIYLKRLQKQMCNAFPLTGRKLSVK